MILKFITNNSNLYGGLFMAALTVIPLMGILGVLFIGFNVIIITLLILTIVFGVIRAIKKKFNKTFIVLLIVTILFRQERRGRAMLPQR